jgi:hypothetical protein
MGAKIVREVDGGVAGIIRAASIRLRKGCGVQ